jgi:hypothetical protein
MRHFLCVKIPSLVCASISTHQDASMRQLIGTDRVIPLTEPSLHLSELESILLIIFGGNFAPKISRQKFRAKTFAPKTFAPKNELKCKFEGSVSTFFLLP